MFLFKWYSHKAKNVTQNSLLLMMPDLVLRKILKECDIISILKLRKVCHGLREFINYSKPISTLERISMTVYPDTIASTPYGLDDRIKEYFHLSYSQQRNNCKIETIKDTIKNVYFKNSDFRVVFCNDLKVILECSDSILSKISFYCVSDISSSQSKPSTWQLFNTCGCYRKYEGDWEENMIFVLKSIKDHLKSRVKPLKVKSIYMRISNQDNLMEWLPYFDPKHLNQVKICQSVMEDYLKVDKILELETLKNISILEFECFIMCESLRKLSNIPNVSVKVRSISKEELLNLKETLFRSSTLNRFELSVESKNLKIEDVTSILGPASWKKEWCFEIPGTDEVNKIEFSPGYSFQDIIFTREKCPVNRSFYYIIR